MATEVTSSKSPLWLTAIAGLGVLWNAFGTYQFIRSFSQTKESLMAAGMNTDQAALYLSLPAWISVVFAVGVFGGLAGSVALLLKKSIALPIFTASLVGYILLFAGDYGYGIFANIPTQLVILAVVVTIAAALFLVTLYARNRHLLA
jgi:hypothetical protein